MSKMRAKLRLQSVEQFSNGVVPGIAGEKLTFHAVAAKSYPADGADEDNTYAKFSPSATLTIQVANPALLGQFVPGTAYYVDFTKAES